MGKRYVENVKDGENDIPTGLSRWVEVIVKDVDIETGITNSVKIEERVISKMYAPGQILDTLIDVLELLDIIETFDYKEDEEV